MTNFKDYKSGQEGLQIGATEGISNRGKKITNQGRNFKSGQRDLKSRQRLQIWPRKITNRERGFQSGQGLKIGAEHIFIFKKCTKHNLT